MSEGSERSAEEGALGRTGREAIGAGIVVMACLFAPAFFFALDNRARAIVLMVVTVAMGAILVGAGLMLCRGGRAAAVAVSAAVPALLVITIGLFTYLAFSLPHTDRNAPEEYWLISLPLAQAAAVLGIPLWALLSYAWSARSALQQVLRRQTGIDLVLPEPVTRTSGLALLALAGASLVFIACWTPHRLAAAAGALLLAVVAQVRIQQSMGRLRGVGFTWAVAGIYALTVLLQPVIVRERESAHKVSCLVHAKDLATAMRFYAEDHHGGYPPAASWSDALKPYVSADAFRCPHSNNKQCGFAFNAALGGRRTKDIAADPARLVLFFESDAGWNAHGGPELLPAEPRHMGGDNLSFADGHAKWAPRLRRDESSPPYHWLRRYQSESVVWDPDAPAVGAPQRH